jgi:hypothetical protein
MSINYVSTDTAFLFNLGVSVHRFQNYPEEAEQVGANPVLKQYF